MSIVVYVAAQPTPKKRVSRVRKVNNFLDIILKSFIELINELVVVFVLDIRTKVHKFAAERPFVLLFFCLIIVCLIILCLFCPIRAVDMLNLTKLGNNVDTP